MERQTIITFVFFLILFISLISLLIFLIMRINSDTSNDNSNNENFNTKINPNQLVPNLNPRPTSQDVEEIIVLDYLQNSLIDVIKECLKDESLYFQVLSSNALLIESANVRSLNNFRLFLEENEFKVIYNKDVDMDDNIVLKHHGIVTTTNKVIEEENFSQLKPNVQQAIYKTNMLPTKVRSIYSFPSVLPNINIGIIALGGTINTNEIINYWKQNCKLTASTTPKIRIIACDGTTLNYTLIGYELENTMDVEIVGCCLPSSSTIITVYHSANTKTGFYQAFNYAINIEKEINRPFALSCSWGLPEIVIGRTDTALFDNLFKQAVIKGINITAASGDFASSDGLNNGLNNLDFPASSPNVIACGGTSLNINSSSFDYNSRTVETNWSWDKTKNNGAGGGISAYFDIPSYQTEFLPDEQKIYFGDKRVIPDVSAIGDPDTGFQIKYKGKISIVGGTSIASPVIASYIASFKLRKFFNPLFYENYDLFHKITSGTNGKFLVDPLGGYSPVTGLGTINGSLLNSKMI
jgi:subtilase family serine protease